ncbi:MAG: flagellar biosynthetic protein FliR [Armatimonadetes bacterium]|nr:flagellar biosynthetic protein FliR [Armatimonadota bacterium]
MKLDAHFLFACLCIFVRCTAMLLSAPGLGTVVPVVVRTLFGALLTFCLVPTLQPLIGEMPGTFLGLGMAVAHEAMIGVLIGGFLQLLVSGAQAAGAFLDVQIGTGSAQVFNPFLGVTATPLSQFKAVLTTVLVFLLNGHRTMIAAFAKSYDMSGPTLHSVQDNLLGFMTTTSLVSLQIAAPVAAVTLIIDFAAGIVNKAVPQTQPFLLSLPAKLAAGIVVVSLGLPALVAAVQSGLDSAFTHLGRALGGG